MAAHFNCEPGLPANHASLSAMALRAFFFLSNFARSFCDSRPRRGSIQPIGGPGAARQGARIALGGRHLQTDGKVRSVVHLKAAYTKGAKTRDVFVSSLTLRKALARYGETRWLMSARASRAPPFPRQKRGHLTAASMARFLNDLYREAGVVNAISHSGRRTLITGLAERGVDSSQSHRSRVERPSARPQWMSRLTRRGSPVSCRT